MSILPKFDFVSAIGSLLYPPVCAICSANINAGKYLGGDWDPRVVGIVPPFCAKCSEPFSGAISATFTCANCGQRTLHFDAAVAAYRSRGVVRRVLLEFKYHKQIHLR